MPYLDSVEELLEAKEGEHVQFKEAKNRFDFGEAARCCCALANDGGGKLVFGISDKRPRSVVGSRAFEQPERTRMGLIDKLKINVDFQLFTYEEKRVLVFDVKSRPIGLPILYEGVAWIYDGDTLKEMPEEKRRKIYEEIGTDFSGKICDGATVKDLDETAIEAFRAKWIEKSGNKKLATRSKEQILIDCGAMTDAGVTYAAMILFGKSEALVRFLPQAEIIFEYRSSEASGPANQREEFKSGFFTCYDRIWELVNLRNDKQHYQEGFLFGRYSLDMDGLMYAGGEWDDSKYVTLKPVTDNVLPLCDEEYFGENDLVNRIVEFVRVVYGADTLEENLAFIAKALGSKGNTSREIIRNYFLKDFFADHCKIYQKRPIYWMFDSGKKNGFKALVYLHRWDADTTGRVYNNYLSPLLRTYAQQIVQENNVISSSNDARTVSTAQKRLDKLKLQQEECEKYEKNIAHLAALRITLDLDDGVKVNYVKAQTAADGKNLNVLAPIK